MQTRRKISAELRPELCRYLVEQVEMRLLAIPVVFILLRMWGTTQFFYSLSISDISDECIAEEKQKVLLAFGILQVMYIAQFQV